MKLLNGSELAGFIKERQAKAVRGLRQHNKIIPKLAILTTGDNPVIDTYVRLKQSYASDILIETEVYNLGLNQVADKICELNNDDSVKGIILQLPLSDPTKTDELINLIAPEKDVDGLTDNSPYDPATAMAINWLLSGYDIEMQDKKIVIVGRGRLVGAPLQKMWQNSGLDVRMFGRDADLAKELKNADIIVSATGVPELIKSKMVPIGATVVDAGTASENGEIIGDVAKEVRERSDITITPSIGGVGPLTISALMDNVIRASRG